MGQRQKSMIEITQEIFSNGRNRGRIAVYLLNVIVKEEGGRSACGTPPLEKYK
jgi:hypothetical protein